MCAITERWTADQRWALFLTRVRCRRSGGKWLPTCQKRPSSSSAGKNLHLNHPTDPLADASQKAAGKVRPFPFFGFNNSDLLRRMRLHDAAPRG